MTLPLILHNLLRIPMLAAILHLSLWLAGLVIIFVPLEQFFAVHAHKPLRKGIAHDLGYYFLNNLVPAAILSLPAGILAWSVKQLLPTSLFAFTASLPFWAHALAALLAGEVGFYWGHRWTHQIPFLWRFHSIHHSAEDMDFLVNTRAHPLDMVFTRLCGMVPMYVLGLAGPTHATGGTAVIVAISLFGTIWGFFIHANLRWKLGPLEWLIATPKFHHWHHTKTGAIDRNYASTLPWLDQLFRTHNMPKEWPESYGIEAESPATFFSQLTYPLLPPESAVASGMEEGIIPIMSANGMTPTQSTLPMMQTNDTVLVMPTNEARSEQRADTAILMD